MANENKIAYEISQETKAIFEQRRSKPIFYIDQIVTSVKKLKEFNEDCKDLQCESEIVDEENGIIHLCEKFSGKLQSIGIEIKSKLRDRRAEMIRLKKK